MSSVSVVVANDKQRSTSLGKKVDVEVREVLPAREETRKLVTTVDFTKYLYLCFCSCRTLPGQCATLTDRMPHVYIEMSPILCYSLVSLFWPQHRARANLWRPLCPTPAAVLGKQRGAEQPRAGCCRGGWGGQVGAAGALDAVRGLCCWTRCGWSRALERMTKADSGELTSACAPFRS